MDRNARKLVLFYKNALSELMSSLDRNVFGVPNNPRHLVLMSDTVRILKQLDRNASRWAKSLIEKEYNRNVIFVNDWLKAKGYSEESIRQASGYAAVHQIAIQKLLQDQAIGISPRLIRASQQLRKSVEDYIRSNKILLKQNQLIRENIAMSVFMGEGASRARNEVLSSLMKNGPIPKEYMGLKAWQGGESALSLVEAPYLQVLTKNGRRRLHIFDHVQMTATTTINQIRSEARNNRMQEIGIRLVRISPNPPLTPCVCSLYAGRIFALDKEAARKTGFPWLGDTPNGGPPFHPYCTHSTIPFIPEASDMEVIKRSMLNGDKKGTRSLRGGMPKGALTSDFGEAQRYFKSKGGMKYAVRQNPQLRNYGASSMASQEVTDALNATRNGIPFRGNSGRSAALDDLIPEGGMPATEILGDIL